MASHRHDPDSTIKILKQGYPDNIGERLYTGYTALREHEGKTYQEFRDVVGTRPTPPNEDDREFSPASTIRHALDNGYAELVSSGKREHNQKTKNWSRNEVELTVVDYFEMFDAEQRNETYNKARHRRTLRQKLSHRTEAAIELKHQNISAVLDKEGLQYIQGYMPRGNYPSLLADLVLSEVKRRSLSGEGTAKLIGRNRADKIFSKCGLQIASSHGPNRYFESGYVHNSNWRFWYQTLEKKDRFAAQCRKNPDESKIDRRIKSALVGLGYIENAGGSGYFEYWKEIPFSNSDAPDLIKIRSSKSEIEGIFNNHLKNTGNNNHPPGGDRAKAADDDKQAYPFTSYSWVMYSPTVAVKQMDKSDFLHYGTRVPRDISHYFDFNPDDETKIVWLVHADIRYEAHLSPDVENQSVRLFWQSPFSELIESLMPGRHTLFSNDDGQTAPSAEMRFVKEGDDVYSVDFLELEAIKADAENPDDGPSGTTARKEGAAKTVTSIQYERDPQNRLDAIRIHGHRCVACGFDFGEVYGDRGEGHIEVHHLVPLHDADAGHEVNPETDLAPVCANCHRMIHRRRDDALSIDTLRELLQSQIGK